MSRSCPFCGSTINSDATLCAACGRFSTPPEPLHVLAAGRVAPVDRLNLAIERWEDDSRTARRMREGVDIPVPDLFARWRRVIGAASVAFGVALLALWIGNGTFFAARFGVASIVTGLALLFFGQLAKPVVVAKEAYAASPPYPAIRFLRKDINLVVLQLIAAGYAVDQVYWEQIYQARYAAGAVIVLAAVLYTSKVYLVPIALAAAALVYIVEITSRLSSFAFRADMNLASIIEPDLIVPLWPVFWALAAMAAFPQLQLLRWGELGIGGIKGDRVVNFFGSRVLLAFGSAVLFAAAATTITAVMYLPRWIAVTYYALI